MMRLKLKKKHGLDQTANMKTLCTQKYVPTVETIAGYVQPAVPNIKNQTQYEKYVSLQFFGFEIYDNPLTKVFLEQIDSQITIQYGND